MAMALQRVQMKRTKGWRKPPNTVYVGRPTKWGNPFRLSDYSSPAECINAYRDWLAGTSQLAMQPPTPQQIRTELAGKNLACWCRIGAPCHADVLLEIANSAG
jgi:hypothetical protein